MPLFGFLIVEGPHDAEFVYRLLSPCGFKRVKREADVPAFLEPLIPRRYPPDGDLQKRMGTPLFLNSGTHSLAICRAEGDARLVETVQENLLLLEREQLVGLGIILDADGGKAVSAAARYSRINSGMAAIGLPMPGAPGDISVGTPRLGSFVFPDNASSGTLEDLLLECAFTAYPNLLTSAKSHVAIAEADGTLNAVDLKDLRKPSGRNKAVVGSVASVLRPGKAIQVSIQDNRWLRGDALLLPRIAAVQDFLKGLFELVPPH